MKGKLWICLSLVAATQVTHSISFTDGNFSDSDWSMMTFPSSPGGQFTEQISAGGNPGAYKRVATINNNFTYNAHLRSGFTYDPSSSGAISSIDWSIDFKNYFSFGLGQGFYVALIQDGIIYHGSIQITALLTGWHSAPQSGLTSFMFTDGISGSAHPNFSASGNPMTFGFATSNGNAATIDVGYDNYSLTVNAVPEPAPFWVTGLGLALVCRRRK